ncbi:DUF2026 family protein [Undibacterium umbellatum]|uniref:DUF2026 family protein n=1 Tax=Undibacterium umbellatum TaxID=2762300 RepID=A0ABR6ZIH0_9BURK|nr:DUF2026 family protein [Undibacterium umbellatum]MBC3911396.1 DUF2026 family protein [Undibacterium umbellatum]
MKTRPKFPLTLPEYERIFRVIHAVLLSEGADISKACVFFSIAGAYILDRDYGFKSAMPIAGVAGYNLRIKSNQSLVLGTVESGIFASSDENFHCWIELDDWIIDFTAPLFNSMVDRIRANEIIQPKMFQKENSKTVKVLGDLNVAGAYFHWPSPSLTNLILKNFSQLQGNSDLVKICADWHKKPPRKMPDFINVSNQFGELNKVTLSKLSLAGAW